MISYEALVASIVSILVALLLGLPLSAVTCGSIGLKKIKSGIYAARGKGMDIARYSARSTVYFSYRFVSGGRNAVSA
ncbi:MAG: hypothetical protein ACQEP5_03520 [Actinomycetota bacterium]